MKAVRIILFLFSCIRGKKKKTDPLQPACQEQLSELVALAKHLAENSPIPNYAMARLTLTPRTVAATLAHGVIVYIHYNERTIQFQSGTELEALLGSHAEQAKQVILEDRQYFGVSSNS